MKSDDTLLQRKDHHLDLCLHQNVEAQVTVSPWDKIDLPPHRALPELNFDEVSLDSDFFGLSCSMPLMISSMTGGSSEGELINARLAVVAQEHRIPMGVGSQRIAIENKNEPIFNLRKVAPQAILLANLGAVQLNYGVTIDDCLWLIDRLEAQAFILHLNPLQEAIQKEGDRNFQGILNKIENLKKRLSIPLIVKEVGCGIDLQSAKKLTDIGIDAIDVAGFGGTHWGYIEGLRSSERQIFGELFRNWGLSTPELLIEYKNHLSNKTKIIASGGLRHSLDLIKAISMGAYFTGMALPFLKAAHQSEEHISDLLNIHKEAIKIALFCMGFKNLEELRNNG